MKFSKMKKTKCPYGFDYVTPSVMVGNGDKPCLTCGELTEYVEIFTEAHFCSEGCVNIFYKKLSKMEID